MLSLLAEYGDDDDDDGGDADADDHEDPSSPQPDKCKKDTDNGMDILDEDAGLSGEHKVRTPHLLKVHAV